MEPIKLNKFEVDALIIFLKDYVPYDSLTTCDNSMFRYLFSASIKLLKAKEQWEEAIKYTE